MKKYLVEFAFSENFAQVEEWQTIDGLENVLFRVCELASNEFGGFEKSGNWILF